MKGTVIFIPFTTLDTKLRHRHIRRNICFLSSLSQKGLSRDLRATEVQGAPEIWKAMKAQGVSLKGGTPTTTLSLSK